jgi:DNA-directed RNA polymerase subunit RPC12/RpoP
MTSAIEKVKATCSHCGAVGNVPENKIGVYTPCPKCNQMTIFNQNDDNEKVKINCPMCGEKILAKAKKCKHCGEMLNQLNITTIEKTSKKFKLQKLISGIIFFGCLFIQIAELTKPAPSFLPLAGCLFGFVWAAIVSFYIWWNHG